MTLRPIAFACLAAVLGTAAGCDSGPKLVKVSGVATYGGKPVPNLRITFQPEKGRPSVGDTDDNGKFTLRYDPEHDGVLVGTHTVTATYHDPGGVMDRKPSPLVKPVTDKYGDGTNGMKIEISKAVDNLELKFD
jgi:hypothetical protein